LTGRCELRLLFVIGKGKNEQGTAVSGMKWTLVLAACIGLSALVAVLAMQRHEAAAGVHQGISEAPRVQSAPSVSTSDLVEDPGIVNGRMAVSEVEKSTPPPPSNILDDPKLRFAKKYAGKTRKELTEISYAVESEFNEIRDQLLAERRKNRQVLLVYMTKPGAPPLHPQLPKKDLILQTVLNPIELFTQDRKAEDPMPVWYIVLTKSEYPELFEMQDELQWLQGQSIK
jgi:hypothetical protein